MEPTTSDRSFSKEPVRYIALAEALIAAAGGLAMLLGADEAIVAGLLTFGNAVLGAVLNFMVRPKVTPMAKVDEGFYEGHDLGAG